MTGTAERFFTHGWWGVEGEEEVRGRERDKEQEKRRQGREWSQGREKEREEEGGRLKIVPEMFL